MHSRPFPSDTTDLERALAAEGRHQHKMRTLRAHHTALQLGQPSPVSDRARRVIAAWNAWRTGKMLDRAVEVSAFATMIAAWMAAYIVLCPAAPMAPAHHHRAAVILAVLR